MVVGLKRQAPSRSSVRRASNPAVDPHTGGARRRQRVQPWETIHAFTSSPPSRYTADDLTKRDPLIRGTSA